MIIIALIAHNNIYIIINNNNIAIQNFSKCMQKYANWYMF